MFRVRFVTLYESRHDTNVRAQLDDRLVPSLSSVDRCRLCAIRVRAREISMQIRILVPRTE